MRLLIFANVSYDSPVFFTGSARYLSEPAVFLGGCFSLHLGPISLLFVFLNNFAFSLDVQIPRFLLLVWLDFGRFRFLRPPGSDSYLARLGLRGGKPLNA